MRLVRIIARLNVGGPAIHAITLTRRLEARGDKTRLVRSVEGPDEATWTTSPVSLAWSRRSSAHATDPGLGDLAALVAFPRASRRPDIIHTFHGHSLTGYYSGHTAALYRFIERSLARRTDALIAVSVRDDLVRVAPPPSGSSSCS